MSRPKSKLFLAFLLSLVAGGAVWAVGNYPTDYPSSKIQLLNKQAEDLTKVPPHLLPKVPLAKVQSSQASQTLGAGEGLIQTRQGPFSPVEFITNSEWSGVVGNQLLLVFGGATGDLSDAPGLGGLRVYAENLADIQSGSYRYLGQYLSAERSLLSITSVLNQTLSLQSASGVLYNFDLSRLILSAA
jgi:hypothetical protein